MDDDAETDATDVARVLAGDREAFEALVARYARRIHDLARRMLRDAADAEEVVQHAFWNAYRALPRFDSTRPFRHWLLRITSNLCRNRLAHRRRHPASSSLSVSDGEGGERFLDPPARESARPDALDPEDGTRVRAALDALPDLYRMTAILRYVHGLPLEEIAQITDEPLSTVKTHLHRARSTLARALACAPPETGTSRAGTWT